MSIEDHSWVFDSLVCFLHGPVWNAPLQTFIEEKSLIFDPNSQPDESNPEFQKIHDDYKNLVDYMLGSFMEEMQITPEQFEMACLEGRNQQSAGNPLNFHQGLFQQIWAANDIKIFVRMMIQRNIELQLQALDLIEKNQLALLQENELVEDEIPNSERIDFVKQNSVTDTDTEELAAKILVKEIETPEAATTPDQHQTETEVANKFERLNLFFEKTPEINEDELHSRQEYLRKQRDKIIEIKKRTRTQHLIETVKGNDALLNGRPSSAHVAQLLLQSGGSAEEVIAGTSDHSEISAASLQLRKTLAKRLRAEVVEKQQTI